MNYSNLRQDTGDYGANVTYSGDTVNIEINNSKLSNNAASIKDGVYKVNGITKSEIKKYYVSGIGQDYTGDTIFFLTNNNEVKYVKLINSYNLNINNGSFTALKLNGISNVIDFYTSDATYKNNMLGGHMTVLAITASAAAALLFGSLLGALKDGRGKTENKSTPVLGEELQKLRREYSNFLSYDGTEESQK